MRLDHLLSTENSGHCLVAGECGIMVSDVPASWFLGVEIENLHGMDDALGLPDRHGRRLPSKHLAFAPVRAWVVRWWLENWIVDASDGGASASLSLHISTEA